MKKNPVKYLTKQQVARLSEYLIDIMEGKNPGGTFRYLIYTVLGFKPKNYFNGLEMKLLELNNVVNEVCMRRCKRRKRNCL